MKHKIIDILINVVCAIMVLFAIGCDIFVGVYQAILAYNKFGVIFSSSYIIIPHWSLWLLLSNIFLFIAPLILEIRLNLKKLNIRKD